MSTCEVSAVCAARVKEATRQSHDTAEEIMMPLITGATAPHRYAHLLQKLYGFYHPLEQAIAPFATELQLSYPFQKSQLLLQDLQALGRNETVALSEELPQLQNKYDTLGALYVLEGAALGGRVIARMLSANKDLPATAFSFFEGRGKETGPHWTRFVQLMNEQAQTEDAVARVCAAATHTFDLHTEWMKTP
ncbi:biliverdin-producing heme oxygenase [Pseudocnuella soli]|uniref:biliverdin-producing heme oxygenase n=1 Tax=Pseudocnuella soli TaxID=2502779 RepID=UPI001045A1CD|nr:biliverdin-producing heme oxygenase [Pseudocnuella soli]